MKNNITFEVVGGSQLNPKDYETSRKLLWSRIDEDDTQEIPDQSRVANTIWALARSEDGIIGAGFVRTPHEQSPEPGEHGLELDEIAVAEKYARSGVGSELLRHLEDEVHSLGHEALHAYPVSVESYDFLLKNGFEHAEPHIQQSREDLPMLRKMLDNKSPQQR